MEPRDIQDNLLGHSEQLSLKKYCCKTALYGHSPRFSLSGTWPSSTTSVGSGSVLTPQNFVGSMMIMFPGEFEHILASQMVGRGRKPKLMEKTQNFHYFCNLRGQKSNTQTFFVSFQQFGSVVNSLRWSYLSSWSYKFSRGLQSQPVKFRVVALHEAIAPFYVVLRSWAFWTILQSMKIPFF